MHDILDIRPDIADALSAGRPVVALETTVVAHGLPTPHNLQVAHAMEREIRAAGAVPAMIGLIDGRVRIGLTPEEIERFAAERDVIKVSTRDLAPTLARGAVGATTVAATLVCAAAAGIQVFATGGIGGVHRGGEGSLDVSADLIALSRHRVAVVCAGAKAILDLPRTLEVLETHGVPVIGYGTNDCPAFFARESGLALAARADGAQAAAEIMSAQWELGLPGGLVIAVPLPEDAALDRAELGAWIAQALAEAEARAIGGAALTPFLLARLVALSEGRTLAANTALLAHNASVAGGIAVAYAELAAP